MGSAGKQLDSQQLFELQKQKKSKAISNSAPAILLAGLTNSENVGAVYRLADAAGCDTIYFMHENDKGLDQKIIKKVSRNSAKFIQTISLSLEDLKNNLIQWPPLIAVEITSNSSNILTTQLPEQCVLVVGNERHGVSNDILSMCTMAVHVPMYGLNGSMNVSHALAIALYEWRRQFL